MKYYGIDLGTTFSAISVMHDNGTAEIVCDPVTNDSFTPSVVYYPEEGHAHVGVDADSIEPSKYGCVAESEHIKRMISYVAPKEKHFICKDAGGKPFGEHKSPVELSSLILKKVSGYIAPPGLDMQNSVVVVTHPAYFDQYGVQNTKEAAIAAFPGMDAKKIRLIQEPVAAALCFAMRRPADAKGKTVLVYDLGGGTFDVSIVKVSPDGKNVESVGKPEGDPQLGGKDWDHCLVKEYARQLGFEDFALDKKEWSEKFVNFCAEKLNNDKAQAMEFVHRLKEHATKDKEKLTIHPRITRHLTLGDTRKSVQISQEEFEELTRDLLNKTVMCVNKALENAENAPIDVCLLVGGSSLMPQVKKILDHNFAQTFGKIEQYDPNKAVALGAAYFAKISVEAPGTVSPPLSRSYGIGACHDDISEYIAILAVAGTPFPVEVRADSFKPRGVTNTLREVIVQTTATDKILRDIDNHDVIYDDIWDLGREVTPNDRITTILKISEDGILELAESIGDAKPFFVQINLGGSQNSKERKQIQESVQRTKVE